MKQYAVIAMLMGLVAARGVAAERVTKDAMPQARTIRWEKVDVAEGFDNAVLRKRTVRGNRVAWLYRATGKLTYREINRVQLTILRFYDADDVQVGSQRSISYDLSALNRIRKGESFRLAMDLGEELPKGAVRARFFKASSAFEFIN